jgi:hypothetical protein
MELNLTGIDALNGTWFFPIPGSDCRGEEPANPGDIYGSEQFIGLVDFYWEYSDTVSGFALTGATFSGTRFYSFEILGMELWWDGGGLWYKMPATGTLVTTENYTYSFGAPFSYTSTTYPTLKTWIIASTPFMIDIPGTCATVVEGDPYLLTAWFTSNVLASGPPGWSTGYPMIPASLTQASRCSGFFDMVTGHTESEYIV